MKILYKRDLFGYLLKAQILNHTYERYIFLFDMITLEEHLNVNQKICTKSRK